jgi:hypothetical protein
METIMSKTTHSTEVRDELSEDKLDTVMGGWFGQWINGGSTTTSGSGTGIMGESIEERHKPEIHW